MTDGLCWLEVGVDNGAFINDAASDRVIGRFQFLTSCI